MYSTGLGGEDYIFKASFIKLSETEHFYGLTCLLHYNPDEFMCC
jgi:hypothetical protein